MNIIKLKTWSILKMNGTQQFMTFVKQYPYGFTLEVERYGQYECTPHPVLDYSFTINGWYVKMIPVQVKDDE